MSRGRRSAGLPLSVGSASLPVRAVVAGVFMLVAAITCAGGVYAGMHGPLGAAIVAAMAILPFSVVVLIAAAFVIAPHSRFGVWLDTTLPTIGARGALGIAMAIWSAAALLLCALRS
jgi:hypothetical protein